MTGSASSRSLRKEKNERGPEQQAVHPIPKASLLRRRKVYWSEHKNGYLTFYSK